MKIIIQALLYLSVMISGVVKAQNSVGLGLGGYYGHINFKSSNSASDKFLSGVPSAGASLYYKFDLSKIENKANGKYTPSVIGELSYLPFKVKDNNTSLLTTWTLQYLTQNLTFRLTANTKKRIKHFASLGLGNFIMIGGTQQRGFEQYSLTSELSKTVQAFESNIGIVYTISEESFTTISLGYHNAFTNIEKEPNQTAKMQFWSINIALFFNL